MNRVTDRWKARRLAGRGRRVWLPLALVVALVSWAWIGATAEGGDWHGPRRAGPVPTGERALAEVADELGDHARWAWLAGLTAADTERAAGVLAALLGHWGAR